ncbi:MAG: SUMF1/EgtB/PvdO family nonheme iron enzyme [Chloroflexi bacterium]|nr:SUMF1/EgtB/PvdO family nonheme iron enzyme [Chloroflexota bacterium]
MTEKHASKRLALIIASYKYQDDSLRQLVAPAQDAEALAQVLQDPDVGDFQVQTLLNKPSHEVNRAIEAFFINRKRDDLLLLYFSGHGIKDDWGRLYFATTDTHHSTPRTTAIPASLVNDVMTDSRSRRQVLLLDCCYSGAFARKKADQAVGVQEQVGGRGRVVLTSSNAVQYSFEGDEVKGEGVRSVFTSALVRGLETGEADRDKDGRISLDELYDYVYERVIDETSKQRPKMFADIEGKIVIARNPHLVVEPAKLPTELQQAIENRYAGVRAGAVSELEHLLQGSDEGLALAARQALMLLAEDDSRSVSAAATAILAAYTKAEQEAQAAKKREQEEQEHRAHEQSEAERLAVQKAEAERAVREKAEKEHRARQRKLDTLYQEAQTQIEGQAWVEAKDLCQQIEALKSGYRDVGELQSQAEEGLRQEQAQKEREAQLTQLYKRLQEFIKDQDWAEAETQCREILALEPEYRDVLKLQAQIQETQARQQKLEKLYRQAQAKAKSGAWAEVESLCQQIKALEPGYHDTDQLLKQAKERLQEEQAQKERQRLARLAAEKTEAERAVTERVKVERLVDEDVDADVRDLPLPRTPAIVPKAQERLRRLLSSVPAWGWAVVGVAAVVLFIVLGSLAGWGTIEEPTPVPTEAPISTPTVNPNIPTQVLAVETTESPTHTPIPTQKPTETPTPTQAPTEIPTQEPTSALGPGATQIRSTDEMVMVYVPGGTFQMGSDAGQSDEQPVHTVTLDAFWIDQTEVTNAQYMLCVTSGECNESYYADNSDYNGANYPVVGVSWNDAANYCAWAGAQLPTEAQWEYAARGEQGSIYPWGNDTPSCELAQFSVCSGTTVPVGSFLDGASWCGALDMAGNVWEWVADWYGDYSSEAQTNPAGPAEGEYKVLRGGSFGNNETIFRSSNRVDNTPTHRNTFNGFRCVGVAPGQ